ncbi:MAG: hypothetical protein ACRCTJ_07100, partial [Brevinema sp.]
MIKLSLYDFDRTIYNGDTGIELLKFLFKYHPKKSFPYLGQIAIILIGYTLKIIDTKYFKENIYKLITQYSLLE